jgi:hypothetical protein
MRVTSPPPPRPAGAPREARPARARWSGLAIAAAVCAAVPCGPFTALAAVILSILAQRSIRRAGGRLRGGTLARVAVLFAFVSFLVQFSAVSWVGATINEHVRARTVEAVEHTFASPQAAATSRWALAPRRAGPASDIAAFVDQTLQRYGALKSVTVEGVPTPGATAFLQNCRLTLHFEQATRLGGATVLLAPNGLTFAFDVRLHQLAIEDLELGTLAVSMDQAVVAPPADGETRSE